ncbi:MAG: polysaccharide biosynthesis/export family protein [Verrucomicrobiales bacterium]|nr:polysaccharide biosynthesis/export family protein [Verrucomicrobiales bacterium]
MIFGALRTTRHFIAALTITISLSSCKTDEGDVVLDPTGAADYPDPVIPEIDDELGDAKPVQKQVRSLPSSLQVGDTLELFVKEDDSFNGSYVVREAGDIILPSVGRVSVMGMSVNSAGKKIESILKESLLKEATVIADRIDRAEQPASLSPGSGSGSRSKEKSQRKILVYITGKVNRPGQHMLTVPEKRNIGTYEAILIAGGVTRFGDEQKVHILRQGPDGKKHKIPVNIQLISNGELEDPSIGEGDIIVVPEKVFGF